DQPSGVGARTGRGRAQLSRAVRSRSRAVPPQVRHVDGAIDFQHPDGLRAGPRLRSAPDALRPASAQRLAEDVRRMGHLSTGFLGTPALTRMLSENGYLADAYKLLLNEDYPSWLYEVKQGATTVWERWDGLKPDSTFEYPGMNSFNHYAYGAVGDWMYRVVAGLNSDPAQPGYKHIIVRPQPGGGFTFARAT